MNRKEAAELLPFIKAFGKGKDIEIRSKNTHAQLNGWVKMDEFIFGNFEYRIKPEPKYRPFANAEECWTEMLKHQPFGWLKGDKCFYNIVSVSNIDVSMANVSGDIVTLDFSEVMEDNTFADGVPFGVKIEDDYNGIK